MIQRDVILEWRVADRHTPESVKKGSTDFVNGP